MANEPKDMDATIDEFFNAKEGVPQDTAPEVAQPEQETEAKGASGSEPAKTQNAPESPEDFNNVPKGFATHPAWQKREQKLKEAEERAKKYEQESSKFSKLLDDPLVYQRWLKAQGYSDQDIKAELDRRGLSVEEVAPKPIMSGADKQDLAESICRKLNWDINRLNPDQRAYLNDQVKLTEAIFEEKMRGMESKFEERLKPLESMRFQAEQTRRLEEEFKSIEAMTQEDFATELSKEPDYFKKVIEPAMHKYLDELDEKRIPWPDATTVYERATRKLLKENLSARGRQEVRDDAKKNARPIVPGSQTPTKTNSVKGKSVSETIDNVLDSVGFRG